jgi:hypothetical protein
MLTYLFQQAPAETTRYMIAGYTVIFGIISLYVISLFIRHHNLIRNIKMLEELEAKEK